MTHIRVRRRLTKEDDLWDCHLMAEWLGLRVETIRRNAALGLYAGAFQIGNKSHTEWRFPNQARLHAPAIRPSVTVQ